MTSPPSAFLASNTGFEYYGEENGKKKKTKRRDNGKGVSEKESSYIISQWAFLFWFT